MSLKPQVRAKVTFVAPDQGGRKTPARSGTRSELRVNDLFTSCVIRGETPDQVFEFGVEYQVTLELLFWDRYKDVVHVGMAVQLNEGNRTVGLGTIEAILRQ
jgi:translation elongation factor EF-Tu-like GTPase